MMRRSVIAFILATLGVVVPVAAQTATPTVIPMGAGWYEDSYPNIAYYPGYTEYGWSECSGGSFRYSNSASSEISFSFVGTGIGVYVFKQLASWNDYQICIDGDCYIVDGNSDDDCKYGYLYDSLDYGIHDVAITGSGGNGVSLDAIHIWGWEPPQVDIDVDIGTVEVSVPTSQSIVASTLNTGSYYEIERSASFGDMATGVLLVVIAILILIGIFVSVVYGRSVSRNH